MGALFGIYVGSTKWPIIVVVAVLTTAYTIYGGLVVSIYTDQIQVSDSVDPVPRAGVHAFLWCVLLWWCPSTPIISRCVTESDSVVSVRAGCGKAVATSGTGTLPSDFATLKRAVPPSRPCRASPASCSSSSSLSTWQSCSAPACPPPSPAPPTTTTPTPWASASPAPARCARCAVLGALGALRQERGAWGRMCALRMVLIVTGQLMQCQPACPTGPCWHTSQNPTSLAPLGPTSADRLLVLLLHARLPLHRHRLLGGHVAARLGLQLCAVGGRGGGLRAACPGPRLTAVGM